MDISDRLRVHAGSVLTTTDRVLVEAADEIDRLRAENATLRDADSFSRAELARGNEIIDSLRVERDSLRAENERLRDAVIECLSWMRCDCGHPHCGKCRATREADAALAAKGE